MSKTEELTAEKMQQLEMNPYQLLEDRVIALEAERDEINTKLDAMASILYALRTSWAEIIPEINTPVEKEDE